MLAITRRISILFPLPPEDGVLMHIDDNCLILRYTPCSVAEIGIALCVQVLVMGLPTLLVVGMSGAVQLVELVERLDIA